MITTDVQRYGTVLVSVTGTLDEDAGAALQRALDDVTRDERDLMVDLHGVTFMDSGGLLHLLALHRRAECLCLRVLVVGWQPQPQQLMAEVAGIRGPGSATGERYALAGFRRLLEDRALRARDLSDFAAGWRPAPSVAGPLPGAERFP
ncbi:STAS domain-containing protein [Streptomyces sp. NPDC003038]|uniref:STAS domain-containing protein n=1 Tax=unclassified Streptomyces TaxID=2593676 RepID=UPI0033A0CEC7